MKGGGHPSPFAALAFPNSKKVPIHCWVDRESFSNCRMARPSLELTTFPDFPDHNRAALTTRPRRHSTLHMLVPKEKMKIAVVKLKSPIIRLIPLWIYRLIRFFTVCTYCVLFLIVQICFRKLMVMIIPIFVKIPYIFILTMS